MRYQVGTQVQQKNGAVIVKLQDGKWTTRARWTIGLDKLFPDQKVFHINGDKADDNRDNLVPITFNGRKYSLAKSRVIFKPRSANELPRRIAVPS